MNCKIEDFIIIGRLWSQLMSYLFTFAPILALLAFLLYQNQHQSPYLLMAEPSVVFDQVVLFGDSITQQSWSYGTGLGASLANKWQRKLDVVNRGLSGYNTLWGIPIIKKWLPQVGEVRPKIALLVIWFGANDAACPPSPQALTLEEFKANLHIMISLLRSPSSPYYSPETNILLLTPPPVDAPTRNHELATREPPRSADRDVERTRLFSEAVKEVGVEAGLPTVDTWTAIDEAAKRDGDLGKYLSDGLHLSQDGYAVVTGVVTDAIKTHYPKLYWDNMEQIFPHWSSIVNDGALGPEFLEKK